MLVLRVDDVAVAEEVSRAVHGLLDTGQRAKPVRFRGEVLLVLPQGSRELLDRLRTFPGVKQIHEIAVPYPLVSREWQPETTRVRVGNVTIGEGMPVVIAGPCSVESEVQVRAAADAAKRAGAHILRGGAYKPRTNPYSFQGLGETGLKLLRAAADAVGLPVVTEVMSPSAVDVVSRYADMLQVGTRSMANFDLLRALGSCGRPVLLKRGMSATVDEWLQAAEYIVAAGNSDVVLCERGIRSFDVATRNTLDLAGAVLAKQRSHLPVVVDPSHGTGVVDLIGPMSLAAVAAGVDGIMVEMHPNPKEAFSDGQQALTPVQLEELVAKVARLADSLSPVYAGPGPRREYGVRNS
ncbi:MAG: 3-deoxy-7-phosphoheptulonate synthase [Firmicutes bacterium]|nr:3-deoxy-7-phosphoheptulonate synthase [Bacillota bacterium]